MALRKTSRTLFNIGNKMIGMHLVCDYLVIGSGASPLAFVDTILDEMPDKKVILIDKKSRPGGHWVDDYDYVKLHQPSIVYGIASKQLEGNWAKVLLKDFMLPWKHRASKPEILDYFGSFVDSKVASGQLQYFPECIYDFDQELTTSGTGDDTTANTSFTSLDGKHSYTVEIREKLVDGVRGECIIPSLSPPMFPIDDGINIVTPNDLFQMKQQKAYRKEHGQKDRHFIVLGCGKTAMDAIVFLQSSLKVPCSNISWVIPNDVWMLAREGTGGPWIYPRALLDANCDKDKACLALEATGDFVRLDKNIVPTRFRFPVVGKDEVKIMRKIQDIIRRGRVESISKAKNGDIVVSFGNKEDDWVLSAATAESKEHIFVHCTSPGPFNGNSAFDLFESDHKMALELLFAPPVSISMSCLAKLESARKLGTLDVDFGRQLLKNDVASVNEVLCLLVKGLALSEVAEVDLLSELRSNINLAIFIALLDKDPMVGYNWLKSNRLSVFSIPGFKGHVVEDMNSIVAKGKELGSPADQLEMIQQVADKLEPLRGK